MSAQASTAASYPDNTKNPASWTPEQRKAFRMERARATPESEYRVGADGCSAVVIVDRPGQIVAYGYRAKTLKVNFAHRFQSAEHRARFVSDWMERNDRAAAESAARRAEAKAKHSLQVGDVLASSWGYEQTNVNFYEVVAVRGCAVDLREIAKDKTHTNDMQGRCTAARGEYIGELIAGKRPSGRNSVRIDSSIASPWDGTPMHWSSYH